MLKEQILKYKSQKKGIGWIAKQMKISEEDVKQVLKDEVMENGQYFLHTDIPYQKYDYILSTTVDNDKGTLKSEIVLDYEPKDDVELAELHKVDLEKYKISSYWTKQKGDKFYSSLLCTLKKPSDYSPEDFAKFLEGYKSPVKKQEFKSLNLVDSVDVELSIADFHLGKKVLENEDYEQKAKQYVGVVTDLVSRVKKCYNIEHLVFPISNDFFHTDNYQNQTTNGTPQDVLSGFNHEYEVGFDLLVQTIEFLRTQVGHVEVVLVQGNHDRTKSFYLAHALDVYFKTADDVTFQREHSTTKSVVLGNTFIGYHHGNCKIDQLPLLFSTGKDSFDFGAAKFREVHTGDKHHYMAKEIMGCRIQQMPSLSGTDRWHEDNNFVHNVRAGLALVYDATKGKICEFESRI